MPKPALQIRSYKARHEKAWKQHSDGSFRASIYVDHIGVVDVFTFPGDAKHEAFTTLEIYLADQVYHCRLDRHYHRRWIKRLAWQFAHECDLVAFP